jgi:hypothetical protein
MSDVTLTRWGTTQSFKLKVPMDDDRLTDVLEFVQPDMGVEEAVLTPEVSQVLLTRLLEASGAKIVLGAVVVEWDELGRPDLAIFENGAVRELVEEKQPEIARRIVAAAGRRPQPDDRQEAVDRGRLTDHQGVHLPEGESDEMCTGDWTPYEVDGGWMAWDTHHSVFDSGHTYATSDRCWRRVSALNWLRESNGVTMRLAEPEN